MIRHIANTQVVDLSLLIYPIMKKIYTAVLIVVLFSCTSVPSSEKDISPGDMKGDVKKETGATGIHRFILNPAVKAVYRYLLNNLRYPKFPDFGYNMFFRDSVPLLCT